MDAEKDANALAAISASTQQIAVEIEKIRHQRGADNIAIQDLLERLYNTICDLSEFKRVSPVSEDKTIEADQELLAVWYGLFAPIRALSSWMPKPEGRVLGSRMMLFVMQAWAFQEGLPFDLEESQVSRDRVRLQIDFCLALDEALLANLGIIWNESQHRDDFRWALTHLGRNGQSVRTDYNKAAMRALSPKELWKVPGMTAEQNWVPQPNDEPIYDKFEHATAVWHGEPDTEGGRQPIIRQTLYSEGPLRFDMTYCLIDKDDPKKETWLKGPRLLRSMQFVLDARQILYPRMVKERNRIAREVLGWRLPMELLRQVFGYLETPDRHPYLSALDLTLVYRPLMAPPAACVECDEAREAAKKEAKDEENDGKDGDGKDKGDDDEMDDDDEGDDDDEFETWEEITCPMKSFTVWNLALRGFHTFHPYDGGALALCEYHDICPGHHEDDLWPVGSERSLRSYLESIIAGRLAPDDDVDSEDSEDDFGFVSSFPTLESAGFGSTGTLKDIQNGDEALVCQWKELPRYGLDDKDFEAERAMMGGTSGLLNAMLHNRSIVPVFNKDGSCQGTFGGEATWVWGWRTEHEEKAVSALKMLHNSCAWC
ncbi:hypothetical protein QQX98_011220 [Neonectria punicea]|uniref:F-box domain-containing protein n=1 Tax=Neonectria punicea TaxID=979145 RepID=A0ABR1GMJ1_9HYPO